LRKRTDKEQARYKMEFKVGIEKDLEHLNNITPLPMKDRKVEELSATEQNKVILQIAKTPFSR